jgi:ABC-type anion transport system duplicated permease subunit
MTSSLPPVATPVISAATEEAIAVMRPAFVSLVFGLIVTIVKAPLVVMAAVELPPEGAFWTILMRLPAAPTGTAVQRMPSPPVVLGTLRLAWVLALAQSIAMPVEPRAVGPPPLGIWIGLRPKLAEAVQPLAQFLAAFPANLLFPPFVVFIVSFNLSPDIWLTPLMVLGTQWYILFNVVAGAAAFPGDLQEAAENFRVGGFLWWRKVMIPGIFPYYVTGAITASGGSWNAAIVAEVASWGDTKLQAHGLGAYIANATDKGDMARVVLGVVVMSAFVVLFNRLLWRPLYAYAQRRLTLA